MMVMPTPEEQPADRFDRIDFASTFSPPPKPASCCSTSVRMPADRMNGVRDEAPQAENARRVPRAPGGESTTSGSEQSGVRASAR